MASRLTLLVFFFALCGASISALSITSTVSDALVWAVKGFPRGEDPVIPPNPFDKLKPKDDGVEEADFESLVNMTYFNYTYVPSDEVKMFHRYPHLGNHGQLVSNNYDGTQGYYKSLIGFPVIMGVFFFLLILVAQILLQGVGGVVKLGPEAAEDENPSEAEVKLLEYKNIEHRRLWIRLFLFSQLFVLIVNHVPFISKTQFDHAYENLDQAMSALDYKFNTISKNVFELNSFVEIAENYANQTVLTSTCPQAQAIFPIFDVMRGEIESFHGQTLEYETITDEARSKSRKAKRAEEIAMWVFYGAIMTLNISFFVGFYFGNDFWGINISVFVSQLFQLLFAITCTLELILLMGCADFCMAPTTNIVLALEPGSSGYQQAQYYSTCQGRNPMQRSLIDSYQSRDKVGSALNLLYNKDFDEKSMKIKTGANPNAPCPDDINLLKSYDYVRRMHVTYENIAGAIDCKNMHAIWQRTFEYAFCGDVFKGLYSMYLCQIFTCIALFCLSIASGVVALFFNEDWDGNKMLLAAFESGDAPPEELKKIVDEERADAAGGDDKPDDGNDGETSPLLTVESTPVATSADAAPLQSSEADLVEEEKALQRKREQEHKREELDRAAKERDEAERIERERKAIDIGDGPKLNASAAEALALAKKYHEETERKKAEKEAKKREALAREEEHEAVEGEEVKKGGKKGGKKGSK